MRKSSHSLTVGIMVLGLTVSGLALAQSAGGGAGASGASGQGTGTSGTGSVSSGPAPAAQTPRTSTAGATDAPIAQGATPTGSGDGTVQTQAVGDAAAGAGDPTVVASLSAPAGPAPAAYMTGSVRVSDADMTAFLAAPANLLSLYADGGLPMSNYVRLLAASDNRAVPALLTLGASEATTPAQKTAIGSGLARAAIGAQIAAPVYAAYIQQQVASSQDAALIAAFTSTLAEPATAAFGAGGGAGGGAGAGGGSLTGGGEGGTNGGLGNTPIRNNELTSAFTRSSVVAGTTDDGGGTGTVFVPVFITTPDGSPTN